MAFRWRALALAGLLGAAGVVDVAGSALAGAATGVALASVPIEGSDCWYGNTWGAGRGGARHHQGVDIIAKAGTPVYAATAGRVLRSQGSLAGNQVKLVAGDGTYFIYAHLSAYDDGAPHGAPVSAGTVIGYVGRTGNTSVNHLHFEVHPNGGTAVDPTPVVAAASTCGEKVARQALGSSPSSTTPTTSAATTTTSAATTTTTIASTTNAPPKGAKPPKATPATSAAPTTGAPQSRTPGKVFSPAVRVLAPTGPVAANKTIGVKVVGFPGIPASTTAADLTITLSATAGGKAAAWPCGSRAGLESGTALNAPVAGQAISTRLTLTPGQGGRICLVADVATTVSVSLNGIS